MLDCCSPLWKPPPGMLDCCSPPWKPPPGKLVCCSPPWKPPPGRLVCCSLPWKPPPGSWLRAFIVSFFIFASSWMLWVWMRTISAFAIGQRPPFCVTTGLGTPGWVPDRRKCIFQHKTCEALCCLYYKPPASGKESTAGLQGLLFQPPVCGAKSSQVSKWIARVSSSAQSTCRWRRSPVPPHILQGFAPNSGRSGCWGTQSVSSM